MEQKSFKTKRLITSAMLIAVAAVIAYICGLLPLRLPFGGSFTIASMLPLVIIAYMYGTLWGVLSAFVYSVVQILISYNTVSAFFIPDSDSYTVLWKALLIIALDYIAAYTVVGLAGLCRGMKSKTAALSVGSLVGVSLRYLVHIISGWIFYGEWAEWFFSKEGVYEAFGKSFLSVFSGQGLALMYSVVYNGLYMIPEIVITALVAVLVSRLPQIKK